MRKITGKWRSWAAFEIFLAAIIIGIVPMISLYGCGASWRTATVRDSSYVEVRERVEYVPDTFYFPVPEIIERNVTRDTSSHLENDWAKSDASVSNGLLHHSLETKPRPVPVPAKKEVKTRDSIVFRDRLVKVPEPVPAKLSAWQRFRLRSFWPLLALAAGQLIWKYKDAILKFFARIIRLFI